MLTSSCITVIALGSEYLPINNAERRAVLGTTKVVNVLEKKAK